MFQDSEKDGSMGFMSPTSPPSMNKDQNISFNPAAFSYNIPLDNASSDKAVITVISNFYHFI